MIEKVIIKNFQSHDYTEVEFSKGVNVITGASDAGKSSVLRALLWAIKNRPAGDSIHKWNSDGDTYVDVVMKEGVVSKERYKGKTTYALSFSSPKRNMNFEAVKTDVPEEVKGLFNLTDVNIQTQHQSYFLLSDSPGEIAKKLNEIVGLDIIDVLYKNINSKITSTKQAIANKRSALESIEEQLKGFTHIDKAIEKIEKLDKRANVLKNDREKIEKVQNQLGNMIEKKDEIDSCKEWLKVKAKHHKLVKALSHYQKEISEIIPIELLIKQMSTNVETRERLLGSIELLKEKRNGLFTKYKVCPTCGQSINRNILERMLKQ